MLRQLLLIISTIFALEAGAQTVYKTPSGQKYHKAGCSLVKNVSEKLSVMEAVEQGLEPCKRCKPVATLGTGTKKPQGEKSTQQCRGYTKAKTRCRHKTSIGNGYCFQHQPK